MPLTLAQINVLVRNATGNDTTTLPDTDDLANSKIGLNTFVNQAWWNFLNKYPLREKELSTTIVGVAGTNSFSVSTFPDAIRHISYLDPDTNLQVRLDPRDVKWFRDNYSADSGTQDKPIYYIIEGRNVYLWPTPDRAYTYTLDYWAQLTDADVGGITSPRETGEIIKNGAIWRVFSDVNSNPVKAQFYMELEAQQISNIQPVEEKEIKDTSRAGLDYLYREYDF